MYYVCILYIISVDVLDNGKRKNLIEIPRRRRRRRQPRWWDRIFQPRRLQVWVYMDCRRFETVSVYTILLLYIVYVFICILYLYDHWTRILWTDNPHEKIQSTTSFPVAKLKLNDHQYFFITAYTRISSLKFEHNIGIMYDRPRIRRFSYRFCVSTIRAKTSPTKITLHL